MIANVRTSQVKTSFADICKGGFPVILSGVTLVSLFDFYSFERGLAVVSLVGSAIILIWGAWNTLQASINGKSIARNSVFIVLGIFSLFLVSVTWASLLTEDILVKSVTGSFLGCAILFVVTMTNSLSSARIAILRAFDWTTTIHLFFFFIQVFFWLVFGDYLDFLEPVIGEASRYNPGNAIPIPRFTGLCIEPAHCAGIMYMFLSVRLIGKKIQLDLVSTLLLIAILLTLSALGYFLLGVLIIVILCRSFRRISNLFLIISLFGCGFFLLSDSDTYFYVIERIFNPFDDSSAQARFSFPLEDFWGLPFHQQLFGFGLGNRILSQEVYSIASGIAAMFYFFGFVGSAIFLSAIAFLTKQSDLRVERLTLILCSMLMKPQFTDSFWWLWIGLMAFVPTKTLGFGKLRE